VGEMQSLMLLSGEK